MVTKTALEAQLVIVAGFKNPKVLLEQYPTPSDLVAHLVHLADLRDDIGDTTVLNLGSGTGTLRLGATLRSPIRVVGVELDDDVLATATNDIRRVGTSVPIDWIHADATRLPPYFPDNRQITVFINPPFGTQRSNEHADRTFLDSVASVADVSYSVHNEGSKEFVESFIADASDDPTDAFRATPDFGRQFDFHGEDRRQLDAEVFRIEW